MRSRTSTASTVSALALAVGCHGGGGGSSASALAASMGNVIAYTHDNSILTLDAGAPDVVRSSRPISGLQPGEKLTGIDYRPATGELVGLGTTSRLYRIDPSSGVATAINAAPFAPPVIARVVGIEVDPVSDEVRVLTEADRNVRIDPSFGTVLGVDAPLAFAAGDPNEGLNPNVVACAYTNPFAGAASATCYAIDLATLALVRVGDEGGTPAGASSGELHTIGALGVPVNGLVGFDVAASGGALLTTTDSLDSPSKLYRVDLATGAAIELGDIGATRPIRGLAIRPPVTVRVFGLTTTNRLVTFRPGRPDQILSSRAISGLVAGDQLVGIDVRAIDGRLYALSSGGRIYRVDSATAVATALSATPFGLTGTVHGYDWDPVGDVFRVTSDDQRNLRVSALDGSLVAEDALVTYAAGDPGFGRAPRVAALAHTDDQFAAAQTTVYGIDVSRDVLVRLGSIGGRPDSPEGGLLSTVGALGFDASDLSGLDVDAIGVAFAVLRDTPAGGGTSFSVVDLATGQARSLGIVGGALELRDLALELPAPVRIVGLSELGRLVTFSASNPGTITTARTITGLGAGESVRGIDYRTSTNQLFGVTTADRLVTLDIGNGRATPVGPAFTPAFAGARVACEFDPSVNALRAVSDGGENCRIDLATGAMASVDIELSYAPGDPHFGDSPRIVALANDRCTIGTDATTLYGIDADSDTLVRIGSIDGSPDAPSTGLVSTIGALGFDADDHCGLDVAQDGVAYATTTARSAAHSSLFRVDLATGQATALGEIAGSSLRDAAAVPLGL